MKIYELTSAQKCKEVQHIHVDTHIWPLPATNPPPTHLQHQPFQGFTFLLHQQQFTDSPCHLQQLLPAALRVESFALIRGIAAVLAR